MHGSRAPLELKYSPDPYPQQKGRDEKGKGGRRKGKGRAKEGEKEKGSITLCYILYVCSAMCAASVA